ncbi:hypothetical protein NBRC10512_007788 [Rhodotorula toruloides]|uniref:RHTO0S01e17370g1_1 n=1 Tax=Rhodotorula toruloides TaxID=5286 RepID=A0A061AND4_RHOTO|nr:RHTO0S01e17370g1_1 [Rhodotorula toruloides]
MRPRRWIHPPPCRPPDPHPPPFTPFLPRPPPPPPPRVLRPPPRLHISQTIPSPPPIASTSRLAPPTVEPTRPPPPPQPHPPQLAHLRSTLDSLPPFPSSTTHGAPRLALYRQKDLEGELRAWRSACARCHALLSAFPAPAPSEGKGKSKLEAWRVELEQDLKPRIVRLVAETSRLLLHLNHLSAFTDLDRAFFTSKLGGYGRSLSRAIRAAHARGEEVVEGRKLRGVSGNPLRMGKGLGWERGEEDVAWMVAFEAALRDRKGGKGGKGADEKAVEKFGKLVRAMRMRGGAKSDEERAKERKTVGGSKGVAKDGRNGRTAADRIDSHLLAFLTRIMSRVHARLGTPVVGEPSRGRLLALDEVDLIVEEIKLAEADEGEEVVSMALLESAMSGLEEQASAPQSYGAKSTPVSVDHPLFRKVEEDIEILVARFDNSDVVPPRSSAPKHRLMRDRHAHILYTTIRFLILRARISRSRSSARHSLLSASQLYSILLGLSKSSSSRSPASIARLRVWQTSALYRLVWAHMPTSARTVSGRKEPTVSFLDPGEFDRETATRILDLLDLTRAAVADIPPSVRPAGPSPTYRQVRDPRLIGMSTSFLRTFLETLVRPFAPQPSPSPPHAHPHPHPHHHQSRRSPQAFTPTHDLLDRTLRTVLSLRSWDASLPVLPRAQTEVDHHPWEYRLFSRPNLVIHLVRGWVLAPSPPSQAGKSSRGDSRDHLIPRLSSLLSLFSALVKLPPNECWQSENVGRVAEDVEWAVGEVVERQWGRDRRRGEEGWREEVARVVREWRGEMREMEEERRKREDEARREKDATSRSKSPTERPTISYPSLPLST